MKKIKSIYDIVLKQASPQVATVLSKSKVVDSTEVFTEYLNSSQEFYNFDTDFVNLKPIYNNMFVILNKPRWSNNKWITKQLVDVMPERSAVWVNYLDLDKIDKAPILSKFGLTNSNVSIDMIKWFVSTRFFHYINGHLLFEDGEEGLLFVNKDGTATKLFNGNTCLFIDTDKDLYDDPFQQTTLLTISSLNTNKAKIYNDKFLNTGKVVWCS